MGDSNRFDRFAEYIAKSVEHARTIDQNRYLNPRTMRIVDVAGGENGLLNQSLRKWGFENVTTIDPVFRNPYVHGFSEMFTSDMGREFDLVVGMHPDEATGEILKSARDTQVILVPCCNHLYENNRCRRGSVNDGIRKFLTKNSIPFSEGTIRMNGANNFFITYENGIIPYVPFMY